MDTTQLLTLLLGAGLGAVSSLVALRVRQRQELTKRLVDQYFEVRKEVVEVVCGLTAVPTSTRLEEADSYNHRRAVSSLYFKHYDFLPAEVLEALLVLHACLIDGTGKLFKLHQGAVRPLKGAEVNNFVESCCRFRNTRIHAMHTLGSQLQSVRSAQAVRIHAQNVMYQLNQFLSMPALLKISKTLRKDRGKGAKLGL